MRLATAIGSVLFLLPWSALAVKSTDVFREDAQTLRELVRQYLQDEQDQLREQERGSGKELFPDLSDTEGEEVEDLLEEFVSFRENGIRYELKDVPRTAWFAPYVRYVVSKGIVGGYRDVDGLPTGEFGPEKHVSVEELAKMAILGSGAPRDACPVPRNPLAAGGWSSLYIACAESLELAIFVDGSIDTKRPALRGEVVMTVLQAFGVNIRDMTGSGSFVDVTPATQFAPAIEMAVTEGIVSGYAEDSGEAKYFGPSDTVTRGQMAKILSLALQVYGR